MKYKYRYQERYKDKIIDVKAHTRAEMMEKVQKKKMQIDRQTVDADIRLHDFCMMYLDTYKRNTVSNYWYKELIKISDKLVEYVGNKPVGKIKPIEVQSFLNSCSSMSQNSCRKIKIAIQQIFNEAEMNGATEYKFNLITPKGAEPTQGKSLTRSEQDVLERVIQGHKGEIFISLILHCGLRPAEASALIWKDVDFEKNIITVNKAIKKDGKIGPPKTPSSVRDVPIPIKILPLLKKSRKSPFSPVCDHNGGYYKTCTRFSVWHDVKSRVEQELGRPLDCRLYDLRHTYCTNLERAGVPINIASRLMGHSDISVTSKIYTHASDEAIEIARRCINSF